MFAGRRRGTVVNHKRCENAFQIRGQRWRDGESTRFAHPSFCFYPGVSSLSREVNFELFRVFRCCGSGCRVFGKCRGCPATHQDFDPVPVPRTQTVVGALVLGSAPVSNSSHFLLDPFRHCSHSRTPLCDPLAGCTCHQPPSLRRVSAQPMLGLYRSRLELELVRFNTGLRRVQAFLVVPPHHESIVPPLSRSPYLRTRYDPYK